MYPRPYGNYVLLERLGTGGMSDVDLARRAVEEASFVRFLVIKRVKADRTDDASFIRMFKDEARITAELHHANIAQVYDFGRVADEYYMALEFVPGVDVRHMISVLRERHQRVPLKFAIRILCEVLDGLEYAHNKVDSFGRPMQIVHRDVNPRNIMVSVAGEVKLIDFGVAKASDRLERTRTDHVKGKFAYMAPEQVAAGEIDGRADLFAVGLTLHELVTGYNPFYGLSQVQIMHRLISGRMPELPPPPELPHPLPLLMVHDKALATDPDKRYQSAREFRRALEEVAEGMGGMPSREDLARFVRRIEPDLQEQIQQKMASFAGPIDFEVQNDPPKEQLVPASDLSGSMSGVVSSVTRTGAMMGGMLLASMGGAVIVLAVVALGVGVYLAPWRVPEPPPEPVPISQKAEDLLSIEGEAEAPVEPAAAPQPAEAEIGTAAPAPQPGRPAVTAPPPVSREEGVAEPAPDPAEADPVGAEPAEAEPEAQGTPEPEPAAQPEPERAPEPEPRVEVEAAAPAPAPPTSVATGIVAITSAERGRAITIDGRPTGLRTPVKRHELPVGTHRIEVEGYPPQTVRIDEGQSTFATFK